MDITRNLLWEWDRQRSYPALNPEKRIDYYTVYPLWMFASKPEEPVLLNIPIEEIYGENWAFESREKRGAYPKTTKLMSLLDGYKQKAHIPPIDVFRIMGKCFLSEGNHRLYLSKLLERKEIWSQVWEVDYESFLRHSEPYSTYYDRYIHYNDQLYDVGETQWEWYLRWKSEMIDK